jgi:hypothetical protein
MHMKLKTQRLGWRVNNYDVSNVKITLGMNKSPAL